MEQDQVGAHPATQDRAATPSEPSPEEVSGKAGIPCAFTPGPWQVDHEDSDPPRPFVRTEGDVVCLMEPNHPADDPSDAANARLIASAPELYEALSLVEHNKWGVSDRARAKIAAALAKARGEQVSA